MSGVYIKDFKIPGNCCECYFESHTICDLVKKISGKVVDAEDWFEHRPEYCPLIEVPSHGRLVDVNEIEIIMRAKQGGCKADIFAPTVIPSDEDGERMTNPNCGKVLAETGGI